jgi:hypothetical protein
VFLRGEIQHKNLWLIDLDSGYERQLTNLTSDFDIRDFDIASPTVLMLRIYPDVLVQLQVEAEPMDPAGPV